ncbi:MAG: ABC transporter permease [Saprospiraceae bacterium]|nr:ABC transporter permease [Saprospiraceae bacterium]
MLRNFLKIAWRNLLKNKAFSSINIAGLAIGMAVAMMIGLWMRDELSFNTCHQHYKRLAQVQVNLTFNDKTGSGDAIPLPVGLALRNDFASDFERVARASWNFDHLLSKGEKKIIREGVFCEPELLAMFSPEMLQGNYANALRDPHSIVLSDSLARTLFGDEDPLNQTIRLDQEVDLVVTGVFKDLPFNADLKEIKFYLPWALYLSQQDWVRNSQDNWENHSFQLFAQLRPGADMDAVSAKIRDVEKAHNKNGNPELFLHAMPRWHLYSEFKDGKNIGGRIQFVWLFGIIGVFVLLLACINFMNLSTARSEKRAKEVGVRKTVGSGRGQLVLQFLSESMLIVFLSLLLAGVIVQLTLPGFNELAGKQISIPWAHPVFISAVAGFALLTGLLAGSYPAFYLSSFKPLKVLKGTFRAGRFASLPRQVLVVLQFTVSIALIIGTMVVFHQIQHAKNRPVGYSREGLLQVNISRALEGHYDALRQDLLNTGTVYDMSTASSPTTGVWSNQIGFDWEGKDPNALPMFGVVAGSHDFGRSIGWHIKEGRDFSRDFATDTSALILNESAVALTGLKDVLGKTIRQDGKPYRVIGVVEDLVMESPYTPIKPTLFFLSYDWANLINVKLKPGVPVRDALQQVETVFAKHDPNSPFEFKFADDEYEAKFRSEERVGKLARLFAFLAVFISCLGLFGLSAYVAEQRTKEIGIRKVLGASVTNLWAMLSRDFVLLVLVACLIAAPLAWHYLNNWLSDYEYRVQLDWWVFALGGGLAIVVTLLTVSFQSVKAALANPIQSLRSE